jgi:hypothetical protein
MRLKKKTDIKRTGNKQINFKEWEQLLWDYLQGDSNPMITKIPGKAEYFKLKIMHVRYKLFLGRKCYNYSLSQRSYLRAQTE